MAKTVIKMPEIFNFIIDKIDLKDKAFIAC